MDSISLSTTPRRLGASSLRTFPLAYGCWRFAGSDVRTARRKIEAAIEIGIDLFDHADIYGGAGAAEELFGKVLGEARHLRDTMLLATKGGIIPGIPYDSTRKHLEQALEGSLRRLQIEVVDLYQIHRPDLLAHPAELAATLARLREQGKIREVGVSNYSAAQFDALQRHLPFPIATHQPELSAWWLEPLRDGVLDQCMRLGVTPLAWSPLAGGKLGLSAASARSETNGERLAGLIECLDRLAERESVTRCEIALAFLLAHPANVVPILGTQQIERLHRSLDAFRVQLTRADWYAIVQASQGKKLP